MDLEAVDSVAALGSRDCDRRIFVSDQDGEPYELTRFVIRGDMTGLLYDVPVE